MTEVEDLADIWVEFYGRRNWRGRRQWRWRVVSRQNGNILAQSSEGYYNLADAKHAFENVRNGHLFKKEYKR